MTHPILNILQEEWKYLGKRRKIFVLYMFLFVVGGLVELATPYVLGKVFNLIQNSITSRQELNTLLLHISFLLGLDLLFWIFHGTGRILETRTGFFVKRDYINDKIHAVLRLPIKWHKENHSGSTIDKINRAAQGLGDFSSSTFLILYTIIKFLGSLIVLFFINFKVGLFALIYSSITLFLISRVDKRLDKKYRDLNRYSNQVSAKVFDYISNVITVITLRLKKTVSEEIDKKQLAAYPTFISSSVINELKWAFASISIKVMIVTALIYYAYTEFTLTGMILIGTLYMLYGYLNNVGETFYRFAELYGTYIRSNAQLMGVYSIDQEYKRVKEIEAGRLPENWKTIELKNLSFTYDKKGTVTHLANINFTFTKGQRIALVGESGSGKSTLLSLIRGLYHPKKEQVYCDGILMPQGIKNIRDHVTLIPQEPEIFNNTFRYNITMNTTVTESELRKAIEMAQLKPVIARLPKKLATNVLEKGVSLSGGEKQRLALARGLLAARNEDILLLDEPTSSVDSLNEIKIHENIFSEFKQKTIISSIHRLHLLDKFDYIYLFSNGRTIGEGTFEQLKKNPTFHTMWMKYHKEKRTDLELAKDKTGKTR